MINRVLTNFSYNNKNRAEMIALIMCMLQGDVNVDHRDRIRSRSRPSSSQATPTATPSNRMHRTSLVGNLIPQTPSVPNLINEVIPSLIPERCLELLYHMVSYNHQICKYFLLESDLFFNAMKSGPRRNKYKATQKYPISALLSLLDNPIYLNNPAIMELLMQILSIIFRSLPMLIKRSKNTVELNMESIPKIESDQMEVDKVLIEPSSACEKRDFIKKSTTYSPPKLSDEQLDSLVSLLKCGECSNKGFYCLINHA